MNGENNQMYSYQEKPVGNQIHSYQEQSIDSQLYISQEQSVDDNQIKIHVVDQICGSGKTTAAINYINSLPDNIHVLYITPYLDEVSRIKTSCSNKKFKEPDVTLGHGSKLKNLENLLTLGENIVSTHALFGHMNAMCLKAIEANNYILIMDEVAEVIRQYDINADDLKLMLSDFAEVGDLGILHWKDQQYEGDKFAIEKNLCNQGALALINNSVVSWLFPVNVFKAFKETYILTYLFAGQYQKYYYDLHNLKYDYRFVKKVDDKYYFTTEVNKFNNVDNNLKSLIHIIDDRSLNLLGEKITAFSFAWYGKNIDTFAKTIRNNLYNFFRHFTCAKSEEILWTTFKEYQNVLKGKGYTKGFLACNARATNLYRDRIAVAYLCNRYMQPLLIQYFKNYGIDADQDLFALSELIQFIFRSGIRDDKEIWLYIPSRRMRELLVKWLNGELGKC